MALIYKLYVTRKVILSDDSESLYHAEGHRIHERLKDANTLGIIIINTEFQLTIDKVRRLERLFGSVFQEKVQIIY